MSISIAIGINCYPMNNKNRFRILLASLLLEPTSHQDINNWIKDNLNNQFNSISDVMKSLQEYNFKTYDLNQFKDKFEISFICDSNSGHNYKDYDDFVERMPKIIKNDIITKNMSTLDYFNTVYQNDVTNELNEIKDIFNEFTSLVNPIKTYFVGTEYCNHCNVNRNKFMEDNMDKFIFFSDDDDFNSPLTQKIKHVESYIRNYTNTVVPIIRSITKTTDQRSEWINIKRKIYYTITSLCKIKHMLDNQSINKLKELIYAVCKYDLCKLYMGRLYSKELEIADGTKVPKLEIAYHFGTTLISPYTLNHYTTNGEVYNEDVYFEKAHGVCLFGYKSTLPDYIYLDYNNKNKDCTYVKETNDKYTLLTSYFNGLFCK